MKPFLKLFLSLVALHYGFNQVVLAEEHPTTGDGSTTEQTPGAEKKEHPTGQTATEEHPKGTEHPKGAEHPAKGAKPGKGKKKGNAPQKPTSWNPGKVERDLRTFIDSERNKNDGIFLVKDEMNAAARKLTLEKIHTDKIVQLSDGTSFVCADFSDASGEKVDVDFFMTPTSKGRVEKVNRVQIHKINGSPRYTYEQENGTWVQKAVN